MESWEILVEKKLQATLGIVVESQYNEKKCRKDRKSLREVAYGEATAGFGMVGMENC